MGNSNKMKSFRMWLQERWFQHKDELSNFGQTCDYDLKHYFNKYKYWLKREYRHHSRTR